MVKSKIFLGIFCCNFDQRELALGDKNFKIDDEIGDNNNDNKNDHDHHNHYCNVQEALKSLGR